MSLWDKILGRKKQEPMVEPTKAKKLRKKDEPVPSYASDELNNVTAPQAKKPRKKKTPEFNPIPPLTANEIAKAEATRKGEPWVAVLDVEIDTDNISNGAFNLDWNDIFVAKLIRAGYKGTDVEVVDQWFQSICRNVLQENYEQEIADPDNRNRKDF